MKKKICKCGKPSIPGLISGVALCQYHYAGRQWGVEWAGHCAHIDSGVPDSESCAVCRINAEFDANGDAKVKA